MREARRTLSYHADVKSAHVLDGSAVLLEGHGRSTTDEGRYEIANRVWLYVIVDGLLYRSQMFLTARDARATYARLGAQLGVPDGNR
jgi:hypothetical protein